MLVITDYLKNIYEEFKNHCDGKTVSVKELKDRMGKIQSNNPILKPNEASIYSDRTFQQLYLLKYAYVYGFEYLSMFYQFIEELADKEEISVVSLGCGAMLDYWALVYMLEKKNASRPVVKYHGIDAIKWNYSLKAEAEDIVEFSMESFEAFLKRPKNNFHTHDVYFFPKSISEISDNSDQSDMEMILNRISEAEKDTLHFCITLRKNEEINAHDIKKVKKIIDKLKEEETGFHVEYVKCIMDTETKKATLEEGLGVEKIELIKLGANKHIGETDIAKNILTYPPFPERKEYTSYIKRLPDKCVYHTAEGQCEGCKEKKERCKMYEGQIMINTKYICDLIIKFERR